MKDWLPQDLEDAVAVSEKASARADVVVALQHEGRVAMASQCRGYVRVNAADTEWCFRDITAIAGPWLDGIILPKTESASILKSVDWALTALEAEHGMPRGAIDLHRTPQNATRRQSPLQALPLRPFRLLVYRVFLSCFPPGRRA